MGTFRIGCIDVFSDRNELVAKGKTLRLEPKVMGVLCALADAGNEVVSREALLDQVWSDYNTADERLTRTISELRKLISEVDCKPYIQTIPKCGYRLIPIIEEDRESGSDPTVNLETFKSPQTIALLPFDDCNPSRVTDHFAEGVTEEILHLLTRVSNLKVIGRESAFAFKDEKTDVSVIAQTLNVAYLLQGSIQRDGDKVRVIVRLIQAKGGLQIWGDHYDGPLSHIFKMQDQIARSIVSELAGVLNVDYDWHVAGRSTSNSEAYSLFLQGRQLTHQLNGQTTIPMGIELLNRAVALDPNFAEAWSWLALAHHILPEFSVTSQWAKHARLSRESSDRALNIDPTSSIGLLARALTRTGDLKFDEAVPIFEKALSVDPHNVETMGGYALVMMALGLPHIAEPYFERIIEKDPLCGIYHTAYGGVLRINGKFDESEFYFRKSFELGFGPAAMGVVLAISQRGEHKKAKEFLMDNFHALGPIERNELRSPVIRAVALSAFIHNQPIAKWIVSKFLEKSLSDPALQPTTQSAVRLLFMDRPELFVRHILEKPNPYVGFSIARIWEPTPEAKNLRSHRDFPRLANKSGMVKAWEAIGWPTLIKKRAPFQAD